MNWLYSSQKHYLVLLNQPKYIHLYCTNQFNFFLSKKSLYKVTIAGYHYFFFYLSRNRWSSKLIWSKSVCDWYQILLLFSSAVVFSLEVLKG